MSEYGITETGFVSKPEITIRSDIINRLRDYFGDDVDLTGMSPTVKFSEAITEELGVNWQIIERVYLAYFPQFSFGITTDLHLNLRGLWRALDSAGHGTAVFKKNTSNTVVIPAETIIDNGNIGAYYISYKTYYVVTMSDIIQFVRGSTGDTDFLTFQNGASLFFDAVDVEWVSDSPTGSSPYEEGTDYTTYVENDDAITWGIGGSEPSVGSVYYVKFTAYSARIDITCTIEGEVGNVNVNELYHLLTPITGISEVFNDIAITNASDRESDLSGINRILKAPFPSVNALAVESFLRNLPEVRGAKVIEHLGWFEPVIAFWRTPVLQGDYDRVLRKLLSSKMVGAAPVHILELIKGSADGVDEFPSNSVYQNIYAIGFVSDKNDGSNPYTKGTDYLEYIQGSDQIDWSPGGSEPTPGNKYYVQLVHALVLAYDVQISISGKVTLLPGTTLSQVEDNILDKESGYFNSLGLADDVYKENVSAIIIGNVNVTRLQDFKLTAIVKVLRAEGTDIDSLPFSNGLLKNVIYINSEEDGGGTEYGGYTIDDTLDPWEIDWTSGSPKPSAKDYYYLKLEVDSDILVGDLEIAKLIGVDLISA